MRSLFTILCLLAALLLVLILPGRAGAQTGPCPSDAGSLRINPTWVCLNASPDHSVIELGQAKVAEYKLQFYAPGVDPVAGAPTQEVSIGKPTPNAQNAIWLAWSTLPSFPIGQAYHLSGTAVHTDPTLISNRRVSVDSFGLAGPPAPPAAVVVR